MLSDLNERKQNATCVRWMLIIAGTCPTDLQAIIIVIINI